MLWIPSALFKYYAYFPRQYCFALSAQFVTPCSFVIVMFLNFCYCNHRQIALEKNS